MSSAVIFAGGGFSMPADLNDIVKKASFVVCADSGFDNALKAGISPNVIIGDMDSVTNKLPDDADIIRLKCEKDDTDTEAAINYLTEKGCKEIFLIGALGGRVDHELANIMLVVYAAKIGVKLIIKSEDTDIIPVTGFSEISGKAGDILTLIPMMGDAEGVSLTGLKYLLDGATLEMGKTVGVSNEFVCEKATVEVKKGFILAVKTKR